MNARTLMRLLAYAIAMGAAIDPQIRSARPAPLAVALREPSGSLARNSSTTNGATEAAAAIRARLESAMPGALAINATAEPRALVVVGPRLEASALPSSGPVSFVVPAKEHGPVVRVTSVTSPRSVLPGWSAIVSAEVDGRGLTMGSSSAVVLESNGIEVDRVEHKWNRGDERFTARLTFAPPAAGTFGLAVRALGPASQGAGEAESLPVRVVAEQRRLKILAFDPRPSWASGFVRRVFEADPDFDVVARVRASRGLEVRTGTPPVTLTPEALNPFDLAIVGAPEELTSAELDALEAFARRRGGTVVLLADRKPTGRYVRLLGVESFDEALVEKPIRVVAADATALRASEFAYPRALPPGAEALVVLPQGIGARAPVISMPLGAGRVIFSGLLDAWRYRGDDEGAFDSFWRAQLGREAARAPRRLEVMLHPGAATPGTRVRLRVAVRATDFAENKTGLSIPAVIWRVIDERGGQRFQRLLPTSEAGVFEGSFAAPQAGRYDVRVETDTGASADTPFVVSVGNPLVDDDRTGQSSEAVAHATGGVVVTTENIDPLVERLRALSRETVPTVHHPMRSPLWAFAFGGLVSAEWLVRRRRGLR